MRAGARVGLATGTKKMGGPESGPPLKVENSLHRCFEPFGSQRRISRFAAGRLVGKRQPPLRTKKSLKPLEKLTLLMISLLRSTAAAGAAIATR